MIKGLPDLSRLCFCKEVLKELHQLRDDCSTGPDQIPVKMLNPIADNLVSSLTNMEYQEGQSTVHFLQANCRHHKSHEMRRGYNYYLNTKNSNIFSRKGIIWVSQKKFLKWTLSYAYKRKQCA